MTIPPRTLDAIADEVGAVDVLVFAADGDRMQLVGGYGRGTGWAGVVDTTVDPALEAHAASAWSGRRIVRVAGDEMQRIIGPYWARHATIMPVGGHLVVFGASAPMRISGGELFRHAAASVAACGDIPSEKLLADELEVVQAVRALMDYHPELIRDTARHVASVAADALSCDIAAVMVSVDGRQVIGVGGTTSCGCPDDDVVGTQILELTQRAQERVILIEQELDADAELAGVRIVSRAALALRAPGASGVLVLAHAAERPRGFTSLCQRVGSSVAEAAEVLLGHAVARERLAAERDRYAREARTDSLTGLGNRIAWEEALDREQARFDRHGRPVSVLSVDLDHLKRTNDRWGHAAGDELLLATADLLRGTLRRDDVIVRLGGDEFAVLLPETTAEGVAPLVSRLRAACEEWIGSRLELELAVSIGCAQATPGERLREAFSRADAAMYRAKAR